MNDGQVDEYLDKSEKELYQLLGATLLGEGVGFGPGDAARFGKFGKKWFDEKWEELRSRICGNSAVKALAESPESDRVVQVSTLTDLLGTIEGESSHTLLLAVLITKLGLNTLCRGRAGSTGS